MLTRFSILERNFHYSSFFINFAFFNKSRPINLHESGVIEGTIRSELESNDMDLSFLKINSRERTEFQKESNPCKLFPPTLPVLKRVGAEGGDGRGGDISHISLVIYFFLGIFWRVGFLRQPYVSFVLWLRKSHMLDPIVAVRRKWFTVT